MLTSTGTEQTQVEETSRLQVVYHNAANRDPVFVLLLLFSSAPSSFLCATFGRFYSCDPDIVSKTEQESNTNVEKKGGIEEKRSEKAMLLQK